MVVGRDRGRSLGRTAASMGRKGKDMFMFNIYFLFFKLCFGCNLV